MKSGHNEATWNGWRYEHVEGWNSMSTDIHGISITITSGRYIGRHKPDGIVWVQIGWYIINNHKCVVWGLVKQSEKDDIVWISVMSSRETISKGWQSVNQWHNHKWVAWSSWNNLRITKCESMAQSRVGGMRPHEIRMT